MGVGMANSIEKINKGNASITMRSVAIGRAYVKYRRSLMSKSTSCPLCLDVSKREVVQKYSKFSVIKNDFPYQLYESARVKSHLMVVPHRHVPDFAYLTKIEAAEYMVILQEYSALGYNSMTRAEANIRRSIPDHLHTHLILTE